MWSLRYEYKLLWSFKHIIYQKKREENSKCLKLFLIDSYRNGILTNEVIQKSEAYCVNSDLHRRGDLNPHHQIGASGEMRLVTVIRSSKVLVISCLFEPFCSLLVVMFNRNWSMKQCLIKGSQLDKKSIFNYYYYCYDFCGTKMKRIFKHQNNRSSFCYVLQRVLFTCFIFLIFFTFLQCLCLKEKISI